MERKTNFLITCSVPLLLGIFLCSSCGDKTLKKKIEQQKAEIASLQDSLKSLNELAEHELLYLPDGDPQENISICKAKNLYKQYDERAELLKEYIGSSSSNFEPSRTISFEYQELVNYFNFIEKLTEKTGNRISKLRFFFGRYDEDNRKYPGQQMLFFNPTIVNKKGQNITYAIKQEGNEFSIIDINKIEEYDCENEEKIYNKGSIFSSNIQTSIISLEGQGGQIHPPD